MNRRTVLGTTGAFLGSGLTGCLGGPEGGAPGNETNGDGGSADGARRPLDVRIYNYREEAVSVAVSVDADGERLVDETVDLPAPETVSSDTVVGTVPEGTVAARIEASASLDGETAAADRSFDLPAPDPIEGFEVRVDDRGISITTLGYDAPT